jgi:CRISPR-associated endoribonuclease Cas6
MRVRFEFKSEAKSLIKWNYQAKLQGVIFHTINQYDAKLSDFLHDKGVEVGSKVFKPFTFSLICPEKYRVKKEGLVVDGKIKWWVSSPLSVFINALINGFFKKKAIRIGKSRFNLVEVEIEREPKFNQGVVFETISPVVVSTGRKVCGVFKKQFVEPENKEFWQIINKNLKSKYMAFYEKKRVRGGCEFKLLQKPRSHMYKVYGIDIRAWEMVFLVRGDARLIKVGYECGFGERNAQGFGMVKTV